MKKFALCIQLILVLQPATLTAQTASVYDDGKVFFRETFGWANQEDPRGWTAPTGYYMVDPKDIGYNWVWWPPETGFVGTYTNEAALHSTTRGDGYLALFLEQYGLERGVWQNVDNSVVFPIIDCSEHASVIVRFETQFMAMNIIHMYLEVSVDNWFHTAIYDVGFGCNDKDRPRDNPTGIPALFEANITDVAAGLPAVQMRLHWLDTYLYFWVIDDFTLAEAYDNDLKLTYVQVEWDEGNPFSSMSGIFNIPKSQLDGNNGFSHFQSGVVNMGRNDLSGVYLALDVVRNGSTEFYRASSIRDLSTAIADTFEITDKFSPKEYGHYQMTFEFKTKEPDTRPADNKKEIFFNVTDSVYSRSDDFNEVNWSLTRRYYNNGKAPILTSVSHFVGSVFPIFNDCEVSSVSVYITGGKADENIQYRFTLFLVPNGDDTEIPYELLTTQTIRLDSADFNTWVTLPFDKDGESEFLKKGDLVYVGIAYDNNNSDPMVRRNMGLEIGSDNSVKLAEATCVSCIEGNWAISFDPMVAKRNLMIRLNLNDHNNRIDGVLASPVIDFLGQNFPNPFSQSTEIPYELDDESEVRIAVMDLAGNRIIDEHIGYLPAGKHSFCLDAGNLPAGIYYYSLQTDKRLQTRQMVILK